ncbi:MAG: carbohydrate ABC transporter permease [Oscillospiraceae bacterium]|nr:carbohydrate ABC transporter permease [Oscillospiraceae bacterium]
MYKHSASEKVFDVFNATIIVLLVFVTLYPLVYVLFASFSDAKALLRHAGPLAAPLFPLTIDGYRLTFNNANIIRSFFVTVFLVFAGTALSLSISLIGAFVVTRKHFALKSLMMTMMVITMFFSGGIIPMFFVVQELHIYNTIWAQILPYMISTYNIIIIITFFRGIPDSLEESATIDGASDFVVFIRIFLPLSIPVIAVIALYYGVGYWNSWYPALVFIRDRSLYPMQMILREILIANQTTSAADAMQMVEEAYNRELVKYCTIVVSTVPILVCYPFLQRYFVKGVMIGAIKG